MIRLEAIVIAVLGAVLGVGMGLVFGLALMALLARRGPRGDHGAGPPAGRLRPGRGIRAGCWPRCSRRGARRGSTCSRRSPRSDWGASGRPHPLSRDRLGALRLWWLRREMAREVRWATW